MCRIEVFLQSFLFFKSEPIRAGLGTAPAGQVTFQYHAHRLNVHFGTFGDLCFQGTSQVPDVPLRAVIATAERGKHLVELLLLIHRPLQPERTDSPFELTNPFHLGSPQPTVQCCGQHRKEPLGAVLHL